MDVKNQKFLILGISKSGYFSSKYILDKGGKCYIYEELSSDKINSAIDELISLGAIRVSRENIAEILEKIDVVIISPGVPINHEIAVLAKKSGKRIIGELEFGFLQFAPLTIAITGTNGKTTTVNMLGSIFSESKRNYKLVGNVGVPVSSVLDKTDKESVLIAEVSSFQLESIHSFCPHIACVLNISPDHLERHYSMENYIFLKKRILTNLTKSEYAILNYDDETVKNFAQEVKCNVLWVSTKTKTEGAYYMDGKLFYNDEFIASVNELPFKGEHNIYNALFAVACAKTVGISTQNIADGLLNFKGVSHRIELIAYKDGIKFYDDSKATNTASTITAIESMSEPTVLILGGSEKGENYDELFRKIKGSIVKHTVITGASRLNMLESAGKVGCENLTVTEEFEGAVKIAKLLADGGDNVLLSPACASFDRFSNYEERGEKFKKIVESLFE